MALSSYSDVQSAVASWLARDDLTTQIPDFIRLAESRMNRDLRLRVMLKQSTAATTADDDTISLPNNFLQARDIFVDGSPKMPVSFVTPSHYSAIWGGSTSGKPKVFTTIGSELRLGPSPDSAYTLEILYYERIPALTDANTSNDILTYYPDLYLYGALVEAEPFLQNDQRLGTWMSLYTNAVASAATSDERETYSGGPLVMRTLYLTEGV